MNTERWTASHGIAWLLLLLALLIAQPLRGQQETGHAPLFYLVVAFSEPGSPRVVFAAQASSPYKQESLTPDDFENWRRDVLGIGNGVGGRASDGVAVTVQDAKGQAVYLRVFPILAVLRGEFHGDQLAARRWAIEHSSFSLAEPLTAVRFPIVPVSRILLESKRGSLLLDSADLLGSAKLLRSASGTQADPRRTVDAALSHTASADNRVDLLIMGDGYTALQQQKFLSDAALVEQQFLGITPYQEYRNYVRVTKLFVASQQSGADHPPYNASCVGDNPSCCADPAAQTDPLAGSYVNTALGSRYCAFNVHRLLVPNTADVLGAASAVATWDQIILLVNDTTYGGSGGTSIATLSLAAQAVDIARHEYGHSFTQLADEYDTPFPGFPGCSDRFGPSCEANVTDETNASLLKWSPWVPGWVPIPTPEGQPLYAGEVGLFEGARYLASGMYRPRDVNCLMQFLGEPFGEICRQEYVLRLYRGGWGNPVGGIENIEPGSPRPAAVSFRKCSGPLTLSVQALQPVSGPPVEIRWLINGTPVTGATTASFVYSSTPPQEDGVTVTVQDTTPFVHPLMENGELFGSHLWNIETVPLPDTLVLQSHTVTQSEVYEACQTISLGPAFVVDGGGDLTLQAGTSVSLRSGFAVMDGGRLRVVVDPVFPSN